MNTPQDITVREEQLCKELKYAIACDADSVSSLYETLSLQTIPSVYAHQALTYNSPRAMTYFAKKVPDIDLFARSLFMAATAQWRDGMLPVIAGLGDIDFAKNHNELLRIAIVKHSLAAVEFLLGQPGVVESMNHDCMMSYATKAGDDFVSALEAVKATA